MRVLPDGQNLSEDHPKNISKADHRVTGSFKGPVLPLEWRSRLDETAREFEDRRNEKKRERLVKIAGRRRDVSSESDNSSDSSDVGPPKGMFASLQARRIAESQMDAISSRNKAYKAYIPREAVEHSRELVQSISYKENDPQNGLRTEHKNLQKGNNFGSDSAARGVLTVAADAAADAAADVAPDVEVKTNITEVPNEDVFSQAYKEKTAGVRLDKAEQIAQMAMAGQHREIEKALRAKRLARLEALREQADNLKRARHADTQEEPSAVSVKFLAKANKEALQSLDRAKSLADARHLSGRRTRLSDIDE